jgi:RNA recognition motif-containing protein
MNIYVGNLSLEVTEDKLRKEFTEFGEVISVTIMNDKYGVGQSSGSGFVEMPSQSEAEAAIIALNKKTLGQRTVDVIQALPLSTNKGNVPFYSRGRGRLSGKGRKRRY